MASQIDAAAVTMTILAVALSLLLGLALLLTCDAFVPCDKCSSGRAGSFLAVRDRRDDADDLSSASRRSDCQVDDEADASSIVSSSAVSAASISRRNAIMGATATLLATTATPTQATTELVDSTSTTDTTAAMFAPKFVQQYDDFIMTPSGMSYRVVNSGSGGTTAQVGDRVVFDWSGYTIGYFGRPFQAKGGPQGGAFDKDLDYERTVLGSGKMVRGLEEALTGMTAGSVRQVIVPFTDALSYPQAKDPAHEQVGPKPSTFSGQRALNFVLDNPRLDRTLLFNVKVIRVDKPNASGGFVRG